MKTIIKMLYGLTGILALFAGVYFLFSTIRLNSADRIPDETTTQQQELPQMSGNAFISSLKNSAGRTWDNVVTAVEIIGSDVKEIGGAMLEDMQETIAESEYMTDDTTE